MSPLDIDNSESLRKLAHDLRVALQAQQQDEDENEESSYGG